MDSSALQYADNCFDRVLCMHVLDFVEKVEQSIREIVRVLSPGGRFTLTMPSRPEGTSLGLSLARDQIRTTLRSGRSALGAAAELLVRFPLGLLYLPLLARPQRRSFSPQQIHELFVTLPVHRVAIEEERAYQDFIVSGVKA
jgi:2-polyprenyl-3-methyl-5-hydroxy-6-metoxy-1,4-benzoquinol methylase